MTASLRTVPLRTVLVTGLGVVSPIGAGLPDFLEALRAGTSGTGPVTSFDASAFPCRVAGEVKVPEESLSYPIAGKELRNVKRVSRFAMAAAYEALEDAGLAWRDLSHEERQRLGVWVGTGGGGVTWGEEQYEIYFREGWEKTSVFGLVSALSGMISSDLSTAFGAHGPSHVVTTGCTSSSDALSYAAQAVALGQVDRAVVGGTEAPLARGIFSNFCKMRAMPTCWNDRPEAASRPFDRDRDGFVLGEGAWFVVLEELTTALARDATPYAALAGWASTCDAFHRTRNHPSGEETVRAIETALANAGLSASDVGYVNLHGTATPLNDPVETLAMKKVFGPRAGSIPMSSLKSQVGHPQGASGAGGLVATLLGLRHRFVPPTINLDNPAPDCDLDYVPNASRPWKFDTALVNCISFGSKNTALVVTTRSL